MIEPYPLLWPEGEPETESYKRRGARFAASFAKARDELIREITLLKGRDIVITSNLAVRKDGLPRAGEPQPANPGVAVYFWLNGQLHCIACDRWNLVKDNLRALGNSIQALRGINRWGCTALVEKALAAYAYLPPPKEARELGTAWWEILGVNQEASNATIKQAWRRLVNEHHPDKGGDVERFHAINRAFDDVRKERGFS